MNNALTFLGLILKAGRLEIGDETCGVAARAKKARLIMTASDASQNARTKAANYCEDSKSPHILLPYTKSELGAILGRGTPGMIAITDAGLAAAFVEKLAAAYPCKYDDTLNTLQATVQRLARRKKEARQHKKNIKLGKKK